MKKIFFLIFFAGLISASCLAGEARSKVPIQTPTGLEWLEKSMGERLNDVIASMTLLHQSEVPMARTPEDYYDAIDKLLRRNPALYEKDFTELLADYLYKNEPAAKAVLDRMKKTQSGAGNI